MGRPVTPRKRIVKKAPTAQRNLDQENAKLQGRVEGLEAQVRETSARVSTLLGQLATASDLAKAQQEDKEKLRALKQQYMDLLCEHQRLTGYTNSLRDQHNLWPRADPVPVFESNVHGPNAEQADQAINFGSRVDGKSDGWSRPDRSYTHWLEF